MTQKFIRWSCPNCDAHNVVPVEEEIQHQMLRCDSCRYVNDPLDDTWPRPDGTIEERPDPELRMTRPGRPRQTPG